MTVRATIQVSAIMLGETLFRNGSFSRPHNPPISAASGSYSGWLPAAFYKAM